MVMDNNDALCCRGIDPICTKKAVSSPIDDLGALDRRCGMSWREKHLNHGDSALNMISSECGYELTSTGFCL